MASKCAVPNCKSVSEAGNGITWHYFPKDQKILQEWIRNIPQSDWVPTKWSQICSLHFTPDCFTMESQDTNKYRKKAEVQKQRIRKGSVPTLFPDSPSYLSKTTPLHRSDNCSSEKRWERAIKDQDAANASFLKADDIATFEDLYIKLQKETLPDETYTIQRKDDILISGFEKQGGVEVLKFGLIIAQDLSFDMFVKTTPLDASKVSHITSSKLRTVSAALNVVAWLKNASGLPLDEECYLKALSDDFISYTKKRGHG